MTGHSEFENRIKRITRRAAQTPAGRAAAMRRRTGMQLHRTLGLPISALIGLSAGWGGLIAAHLWLRPWWDSAASGSGSPVAELAGLELETILMGLGPALAVLLVMLLGFCRFWHVAAAAACSASALQVAPFVLDYWPQIAQAPPPAWMVAAFTA